MNYTKAFFTASIGVAFSSVALGTIFYFTEKTSNSSTILGPAKDWAWLGIVFGGILGLVLGGAANAIIISFQLNMWKSVLFGFVLNCSVGVGFYLYSGGGWSKSLVLDFFAILLVGIMNSGFVSYFAQIAK